ncbi:hypothetical protein G6F66_015721 [Rhizopus arrhizus]|nr:hypothetical protein G6F66_015721 [Rhizopus arrhizus]
MSGSCPRPRARTAQPAAASTAATRPTRNPVRPPAGAVAPAGQATSRSSRRRPPTSRAASSRITMHTTEVRITSALALPSCPACTAS